MNKQAIFTILYGETYRKRWREWSEPSWREYAARHGYDMIVVEEPIRHQEDLECRPIHWQKLFIPRHPDAHRYERIVFLDADIKINYHRAPDVAASVSADRIGMTRFDAYIDDPVVYDLVFIRRYKFARYRQHSEEVERGAPPIRITGPDYTTTYAAWSDRADWPLINTGLMVIDPRAHGDLLESIYDRSFHDLDDGAVEKIYEQNYVSFKLLEAGIVHFLDPRFNTIAYLEQALHYPFLDVSPHPLLLRWCYSTLLSNCYFLHFAANWTLMPYAVINDDKDLAIMDLKDIYRRDQELNRSRVRREEASV